jgi:hypothetical protein
MTTQKRVFHAAQYVTKLVEWKKQELEHFSEYSLWDNMTRRCIAKDYRDFDVQSPCPNFHTFD